MPCGALNDTAELLCLVKFAVDLIAMLHADAECCSINWGHTNHMCQPAVKAPSGYIRRVADALMVNFHYIALQSQLLVTCHVLSSCCWQPVGVVNPVICDSGETNREGKELHWPR